MGVAQMGLDVTAHDIANVSTPDFRPGRVEAAALPGQAGAVVTGVSRSAQPPAEGMSGTDLAEETVSLVVAGAAYGANAAALRTQLETTGTLVDLLA